MRILVVSDHEEKQLYDFFDPDRWVGKVDLAISCGDLRGDYLSYLVTVLRVPLLYVAGNHDGRFEREPPEGCDDIDGKVVRVGGLRIAGLAGCLKYNDPPGSYQYTERQLWARVHRLALAVWRAGGADIVVSHAAPVRCPLRRTLCVDPAGLGRPCIHPELPDHPDYCPEAVDVCHTGIEQYNDAIKRWKPRWWFHGHTHIEYGRLARLWWQADTQIINADGPVLIDTSMASGRERGSLIRAV
jgi:predicted phosphodiesterase